MRSVCFLLSIIRISENLSPKVIPVLLYAKNSHMKASVS